MISSSRPTTSRSVDVNVKAGTPVQQRPKPPPPTPPPPAKRIGIPPPPPLKIQTKHETTAEKGDSKSRQQEVDANASLIVTVEENEEESNLLVDPRPPEPVTTPVRSRSRPMATLEDDNGHQHGNSSSSSSSHGVETPLSSSSRRMTMTTTMMSPPQKFVFLSDQKTVPSGLMKLYESTLQRRRRAITQIHNFDCQVAALDAKYADEAMDLDLALGDTMDRSVCTPLEEAMDRLVMERESSQVRGPLIGHLERQLASMQSQMMQHSHVELSKAKRDLLDGLQTQFVQDILPQLRMEDSKSEKMEGGVIRRFENVAGVVARQFHQEAAARRASVELVRQNCASVADHETQRDCDLLKDIRTLRDRVKKEREQRKRQDMIIMDDIRRTTVAMKRALLAAVGGG